MAGGFEELEVYKAARELRRRVYKLTRQLPDDERFNLVSQMRRAAVSMTNNIAEGCGSRGWKHNISHLYRSRGSVCELMDDFNVCEDEQYFDAEHLNNIREDATTVLKLINGYITCLRKKLAEDSKKPHS